MPRHLLPLIPTDLSVERVRPSPDRVTILAVPKPTSGACPACGHASARVHSHYTRRLADLPWQGCVVALEVRIRQQIRSLSANLTAPTRRRERQMKRFKSAGHAQRFLSAHDQINNLFHLRRDHVTATEYRTIRSQAFAIWDEITGAKAAA